MTEDHDAHNFTSDELYFQDFTISILYADFDISELSEQDL